MFYQIRVLNPEPNSDFFGSKFIDKDGLDGVYLSFKYRLCQRCPARFLSKKDAEAFLSGWKNIRGFLTEIESFG